MAYFDRVTTAPYVSFNNLQPDSQPFWHEVYTDEAAIVQKYLKILGSSKEWHNQAAAAAHATITSIRSEKPSLFALEPLIRQYSLTEKEGVALMCLAEALLRVPDAATRQQLLQDKLLTGEWDNPNDTGTMHGTVAAWFLKQAKTLVHLDESEGGFVRWWNERLQRLSVPAVASMVERFIAMLARVFVYAEDIDSAVLMLNRDKNLHRTCSFDMLGESAYTNDDADRYFHSYKNAIRAVGLNARTRAAGVPVGISVKLSALHPRFKASQADIIRKDLAARLLELARYAADYDLLFTIDAEESDKLLLTLNAIHDVFMDPLLGSWNGFGFAVQCYQKAAAPLIDYLAELAAARRRRFNIRIIKGAYWDTEIKVAQQNGMPEYPVFTRKYHTDVSYLACAQKVLANNTWLTGQFATHNAYSTAVLLHFARERGIPRLEFQRLHGMGEELHDRLMAEGHISRVYAPVGSYSDLLPYLVRRLLENGANSSFVNKLFDKSINVEHLVQDPVSRAEQLQGRPHPQIPRPCSIWPNREGAAGIDLAHPPSLQTLRQTVLAGATRGNWHAAPLLDGQVISGRSHAHAGPVDPEQLLGTVINATPEQVDKAYQIANRHAADWAALPVNERAQTLRKAADLLLQERERFIVLLAREAGKTLADAIGEYREAVDFLRYYANEAQRLLEQPIALPGATGEQNTLRYHGRGVFACIAPWNFPLAIFIGQVAAALVTGNAVLAKPAKQTPLIGFAAIDLLLRAGIPKEVLHFIPGDGAVVGQALITHHRCAGVVFTGSTRTAQHIAVSLAQRGGALVPFIAETGGQNAMIADSSALPEQVVRDVVAAAFQSAGQRCSAARVLYIQEDAADRVLTLLRGTTELLRLGDPLAPATDVAAVIDADAKTALLDYLAQQLKQGIKPLFLPSPRQYNLSDEIISDPLAIVQAWRQRRDMLLPPVILPIQHINDIGAERFGPILHIRRFAGRDLDAVIDEINSTGYGLTLGVHSRVDRTIEKITSRARVGNVYVNRAQIAAVVEAQPFGGEGLSGTGFKAGGPNYLLRFVGERVVSINTTASGGNLALMRLTD